MNEDYKGLYAAIFLSAIVVLGVNYFFPKPVKQAPVAEEVVITSESAQAETNTDTAAPEQEKPLTADEVVAQDTRLPLKNGVISGSIRLKGARFDNLSLSLFIFCIDFIAFNPSGVAAFPSPIILAIIFMVISSITISTEIS